MENAHMKKQDRKITLKTVSVVIPAFNEQDTIQATINSILNQTHHIKQIIVVDDCSTDRTKEFAAKYVGIQIITTSKNTGKKAQAQNYALPYVKSDIVITIDADTTLAPDAINQLVKAFDKDPELFSACGFVLPRRIKSVWERGRYIEYLFGLTINKRIQAEYGTILVCSGCLSAFNTKKLKAYGGFRDLSCVEDMDLTWLAYLNGERIIYIPKAICYPVEPQNFSIYKGQVHRWYVGFFECLKIHWRDLLKFKKPMLSVFVLTGLLEGLLIFPAILYTLIRYGSFQLATIVILFDLLVISIPALLKGWRIGRLKLTTKSIFCYMFTRYVNLYLFYRAFVFELILQRKLTIWEKGH